MLFKGANFFRLYSGFIIAGILVLSIPAIADSTIADTANCHGGNVTICGVSISLPDGTSAGSRVTVPVPGSVPSDSNAGNSNPILIEECVEDGSGNAAYHLLNADNIPCNAFPCQDSNVRLCDKAIHVPGGTPLGGIVHLTMPPPFMKNGFTVQCIGSGDQAPVYQITDHAAVSCNLAQTSP